MRFCGPGAEVRSLSHLGSCQFSVSALSVDGRSFQDVFYGLFGGLVGRVDGAVGEAAEVKRGDDGGGPGFRFCFGPGFGWGLSFGLGGRHGLSLLSLLSVAWK